MDFLWIILLFLIGLVAVIWPDKLWKLEHFLTVKNGEPSEFYLAVSRVAGVFFMLAATISSLVITIIGKVGMVTAGTAAWGDWFQMIWSIALVILAGVLVVEGAPVIFGKKNQKA